MSDPSVIRRSTEAERQAEHARRGELLDRFWSSLAEVDPVAEAERTAPAAMARLGDESWWSVVLPLMVAHLGAFVERPYGVEVRDPFGPATAPPTRVPAASYCRWDPVLAELLAGAAVRLSGSALPAVQLVGLKVMRFLRDWTEDWRRTATVLGLLGLDPLPAQWPAWDYGRLVPPVDADPALPAFGMALRGALGCPQLPLDGTLGVSPRGWCWPWELGQSMPDGMPQWGDDGNPVPVPVVVPADWSPSWPDLYGFSIEATPGEALVVGDPARVLRSWSGRLRHSGPMRNVLGSLSVGESTWWLGRPVPMSNDRIAQVVHRPAGAEQPRPEWEAAPPTAPATGLPSVEVLPMIEASAIAREFDADDRGRANLVAERYAPWRSLNGWGW